MIRGTGVTDCSMNTKSRICFAIYDYSSYGGVESVGVNIANAFAEDFDVYFLGFFGEADSKHLRLNDTVKRRILLSEGIRKKRLREQIRAAKNPLRNFIETEKIDLFVLLGHYPAALAVLAKKKLRMPFVFCDHGAIANQWKDKKATLIRYVASKMCEKTVVLTEKSYMDYLKRFHILPNKITYIYNWIEPLESDSRQYSLKTHKLLSVGRLSAEKGFDQLINAMKSVVQRHPDWSLDIYGDGDEEATLREMIHDACLEGSITLKGRCDRVRDLFKNYAAYIMPSYREGLPIALLEAKMNMLPIVSFDIDTGPREIVRNGVDGILVEPENIQALSEAINRLIEDEWMRKNYSEHAKGNLHLFAKEAILPQWDNLFRELLKK